MGVVASNFDNNDGSIVSEFTHPAAKNWINAHAQTCNIPVVEVERLWRRFSGISNDATSDGVLAKAALAQSHVMKDELIRKILTHFPKNESGSITFQTYCNAAKWFENANVEDKLRALFKTLNNGEVIDKRALTRILTMFHTDESEETISQNVKIFMAELDNTHQGYVDEDQFIYWIKGMPYSTIQSVLQFEVIPQQVQEQHKRAEQRPQPKTAEQPPGSSESNKGPIAITSDIMDKVATRASARDWSILANRLGFTSEDLEALRHRYPRKDHEQVYAMLQQWMDREKGHANVPALETALKDSDMADIADEISQY
ncbi:uncharacterized protein LOC144452248 [Glandiceps talaboti]